MSGGVFREGARCPGCRGAFGAMKVRGHSLEGCRRCDALWMSLKVFFALLHAAQPSKRHVELLEHNDGSPRHACPHCGQPMATVWLEMEALQRCRAHGLWLTTGALERALDWRVVPKLSVPGDPKR